MNHTLAVFTLALLVASCSEGISGARPSSRSHGVAGVDTIGQCVEQDTIQPIDYSCVRAIPRS